MLSYRIFKNFLFDRFFYWLTSNQWNSTMANTTGSFFSPFDIALAWEVPFHVVTVRASWTYLCLPLCPVSTMEVLICNCIWMASNCIMELFVIFTLCFQHSYFVDLLFELSFVRNDGYNDVMVYIMAWCTVSTGSLVKLWYKISKQTSKSKTYESWI